MSSAIKENRLSVSDFKTLLSKDKHLQVIDVRSPVEFASERLDNSVNIPLPDVAVRLSEISKQADVYIICRSGKRAAEAFALLASQGYSAKVIEGGLLAWGQAGFPIYKSAECLPVERQAQIVIGTLVTISSLLALGGSKVWLVVTGILGAGLIFTALTGNCALAMLLAQAPWNMSAHSQGKSEINPTCK